MGLDLLTVSSVRVLTALQKAFIMNSSKLPADPAIAYNLRVTSVALRLKPLGCAPPVVVYSILSRRT